MFASFNPGHVGISVSLLEGLALAERHGFGGYDAPLVHLHEAVLAHGADKVLAEFQDRGLRIGAWNLPFAPYNMTEEEFRAGLKQLPAMLESARALGATRSGMWFMPGSDAKPYAENLAFHVERFRPVAALLNDFGIRLGLEFVGPETTLKKFKYPFIRSVAETLEMGRAIGPNCGLLIDAWHWHCVGGDRGDLAALTRDQLVHVHVDDAPADLERAALIDNHRKLPCTTGVIDIDGFMQALAAAGYDGPVTAEPFDQDVSALPAGEATAITARTTRAAVARGLPPDQRPR